MSRSSLQGTSWHYEYLKTNDEDRRNKKKCIYNKNGKCEIKTLKCTGSTHCEYYKEVSKKWKFSKDLIIPKKIEYKTDKTLTSDDFVKLFRSSGTKYKGSLTVKIENESPRKYKASEIPNDAVIFNKGYVLREGDRFEIDGISILVLKNKLEKVEKNK